MSLRGRIAAILVMLVSGMTCAAETPSLGRLFFTPEKRQSLERQRLLNVRETQTLQGTTISLDGVVHRSSGKSTVWINGSAQTEADGPRTGVTATLVAGVPGRAILSPGDETPATLKVGETINRATRERNNRLDGGRIQTPTERGAPR